MVKNKNFYVVIMAGGSGTRLWPLSRKQKPKQYQKLTSKKSMIQETYARASKIVPLENIFISTAECYRKLTLDQLKISDRQLILEPLPRGTASAIALVAKKISSLNKSGIVATIASDHAIKNVDEFVISLRAAFLAAEKNRDKLVVVGINPTVPDTGLGYIKMGKKVLLMEEKEIFWVDSFVEKPDKKTAEKYLISRKYLWNAGYFIFSANDFLQGSIKKFLPKTFLAVNRMILNQNGKKISKKEIEQIYASLKNEPIDTAVVEKMNKSQRLVVFSKMHWSDVGNWGNLFDFLNEKEKGVNISKGKHIDSGSWNCFIHAEKKLIATVGLRDIIIVESDDAILIVDKSKAGEVKKIIEKLKDSRRHYL